VASVVCHFLPHRLGFWIHSGRNRKGDRRAVHCLTVKKSFGPLFRRSSPYGFLLYVRRRRSTDYSIAVAYSKNSGYGSDLLLPIILNIFVLTHATRFDGTRIVTLMLLANLFLLVWDYDRLKYALPFYRPGEDRHVLETSKFPFLFFGCVFVVVISVIVFNGFLFDIRPGNEEAECTNGCKFSDNPNACQGFCDCIYKQGNPLNACLNEYHRAKEPGAKSRPPVR
jgi:hypothetical protein